MKLKAIRTKALLITCVILLLLGGIALQESLILNQARETYQAKATEMETLKSKIAKIQQEIDRYELEKEEFRKYLFNEQDVPAFLDSIAQYGKETVVNIQDMKTTKFQSVQVPKEITESQSRLVAEKTAKAQVPDSAAPRRIKQMLTLASMPINIQVTGAFQSLVDFLGHLDNFKQLLTITNVDIVAGSDYPILKCAFTLTIYSLKTLEELENR